MEKVSPFHMVVKKEVAGRVEIRAGTAADA